MFAFSDQRNGKKRAYLLDMFQRYDFRFEFGLVSNFVFLKSCFADIAFKMKVGRKDLAYIFEKKKL